MGYVIRPQIIDKIRSDRGLTSDEAVAREINVSLGTIQNIRHGRQPSFATAMRLIEAANVTDIRAAIARVDAEVAA
ncbi:helix-turn-helix transcriptional regulator [Corynebacterium sp. TAE3-ERU2]|uniref:helix-turn-helix domain-containing protein n=1 Tax=Corynebacterium sp. TAE3-ERU2 TaxID=2849497 RepID=UPI001C45B87C|nr:helix-turn-helix transcriptional regulator [Corynebacterium sp. TAE3-ERU2]